METNLKFYFLPVTCDSTKIKRGSTFVACDGAVFRGIDFIPEAIKKGAAAVICDIKYQSLLTDLEHENSGVQFSYTANPRKALAEKAAQAHGYPAKKLRIIGVTGTKGKSSITHLIEHILNVAGHKTALVGGVANKIVGVAQPSMLTTPNSDFLQAFFAACVEQDVDTVVMEVSSHALSLDRVHGIEFDAVGFSNLGQDHLDFYGTMQAYCDAKVQLFKMLKPTGSAIINLDHAWGAYVQQVARAQLASAQIITLSKTQPATHTMTINENSLAGLKLSITDQVNNNHITLASQYLFGEPYACNIALAKLMCQSIGIPNDTITQGVQSFTGTPGRLQLHILKNGAKAFVDFAHSGPPMEAVLQMLRPLTNNLIVLFGCGGDKDKLRRVLMPQAAAAFADHIIITEDNPRTEDRLQILRDIESNIPRQALNKTQIIQDRRQAVAGAVALATTPSSIVAILGKGHEPYQIIGTTKHHFDDYEEIQKF